MIFAPMNEIERIYTIFHGTSGPFLSGASIFFKKIHFFCLTPFTWCYHGGIFQIIVSITLFHLTPNPIKIMPKKKTSKVAKGAATKKAKAPVKKSAAPVKKKTAAAKGGPKPVAVSGSVGFRLRMDPNTHKKLAKMAQQGGVSQNTMLNQLIQEKK